MKKYKLNFGWAMLMILGIASSCNKDWLNAKPNKSLVVPSSLADYQALLDNLGVINRNQPAISMVSDGDYYLTDANYNARIPQERSAYLWAPTENFYGGQPSSDWPAAYTRTLDENIVLEGIVPIKTDAGSQSAYNNIKGSALFLRAYNFYNLAQEFCKLYTAASAPTDLGLPLRTSSDINIVVARSSVQQTYDQIINDLLPAAALLPVTPLYPSRPSKPAAFGLLARVYLSQQNYEKAGLYADSCLQLQSALMDFNQLVATASTPIAVFNKETIFYSTLSNYASFSNSRLIVDPALVQSYNANDLRSSIYFITVSGNKAFKGSFSGNNSALFGGVATDEIYFIRAECYARAGKTTAAMNDLNALLTTRWKTGSYAAQTAASPDAALSLILTERRKELCFRNLRWTDLRRLNMDTRFQTILTRSVAGQSYTLLPNSPRYVFPLDDNEILLGGLQQNPR